jgi:type I restriction enzyme, S subunit
MSWQRVCLGEYIDLISGPAFKSARFTDNPDDIPLVKGDNLAQGYISWEKSKYWPKEDAESYSKYWLNEGDVILAMDRPWVTAGLKYSWIKPHDPRAFVVQRVARMRGRSGLLSEYLRYIVGSKHFSDYIKNIMGGTNVPHISPKQIGTYEVALPPEKSQLEIVKVLSNYDDLIENNKRRIALLEESARQLYKEWFVRFRFPGHEHVKIVDGVPEGWKKMTLGDVAVNYDRRRVPLSVMEREKRLGPFPYYGAAGILGYVDEFIFNGRYLLMGEDGTVQTKGGTPLLQLVEGKFWVSNHAHVLEGKKVSTEFLNIALSNYQIAGHITGVAQPKINQKNMNRIPILVASNLVMHSFQDVITPIFEQVFRLKTEINLLEKARDLLLPKLMSGELAV